MGQFEDRESFSSGNNSINLYGNSIRVQSTVCPNTSNPYDSVARDDFSTHGTHFQNNRREKFQPCVHTTRESKGTHLIKPNLHTPSMNPLSSMKRRCTVIRGIIHLHPTSQAKRKKDRNNDSGGISVKLFCRCSGVVLLLYILCILNIAMLTAVTRNNAPLQERELLMVQPTAFTNMLPPIRQTKTTEDSSPLKLSLYDIYSGPEEVAQRSTRFPSIEQRLKVYLSTWYVPPCPNSIKNHKTQYYYKKIGDDKEMVIFQALHMNDTISTSLSAQSEGVSVPEFTEDFIYSVDTTISHERHLILYDQNVIKNCNDPFCLDVVKFIQPSLNRIQPPSSSSSVQRKLSGTATLRKQNEQKNVHLHEKDDVPILFQFGDAEAYRSYVPALQKDVYNPMVPVIRKYRYSITPSDLHKITSGGSRDNDGQQKPLQCYSSDEKRIIAGSVRNPAPKTHAIISIVSNYPRHFEPLNHVNDADVAWEDKLNMAVYRGALTGRNKANSKSSDVDFCVQVPRCNLVYQHGTSSLVDAMLVPYGKKKYPLSDPLNGVKMFGNSMSMTEMLKYKAIVMLEGNDVSSGLKWALFSNSVVLTQAPTCTSWAMEELLVPWVHYIPINDDLSDVEERVQWILDHDEEAKTIARNGRMWIADLVYHPEAEKENEMIIDQTLQRYRSHFIYNPSLSV